MPCLKLQGVDLHYETFGTGPPLLLIAGAGGNGSAWHQAAQSLSKHYTTICYDRRNYSSSTITGPQDYPNRLTTDASDAAALIGHICPSGKALVVGNSSGAIVALHLLLNHPESVERVIAHEPPAFGALPPNFRTQGEAVINHIYSQYRNLGPIAAMEEFTSGLDTGDEAGLVALKEKLIPAAGVDSGMGVGVAPIAAIAGAVGKEILRLPGGHIGMLLTKLESLTQNLRDMDANLDALNTDAASFSVGLKSFQDKITSITQKGKIEAQITSLTMDAAAMGRSHKRGSDQTPTRPQSTFVVSGSGKNRSLLPSKTPSRTQTPTRNREWLVRTRLFAALRCHIIVHFDNGDGGDTDAEETLMQRRH
ncbi:hypothetical protein E4T44_03426 [Aureobasidium sp. EXF-8845]|nr:hypothetical protein E4T44_03426 [Aureobasidium sp. EXF-8845]